MVLLEMTRPPNIDNPRGSGAALLCGRKKREMRPEMVVCPDAARDARTSFSTAAVCCNNMSVLRSWSSGATRATDTRGGTPLVMRIGTAEGRSAYAVSAADAVEATAAAAVGSSVVECSGPGVSALFTITTEALDEVADGASGACTAGVARAAGGGGSVKALGAIWGTPTVGGIGHVELEAVVLASACVTAAEYWGSATGSVDAAG